MAISSYSSDGAKGKISLCVSGGFSGCSLVCMTLLSCAGWINTRWAASTPELRACAELSEHLSLPWEGQLGTRTGNLSPRGCWIEIIPNLADVISSWSGEAQRTPLLFPTCNSFLELLSTCGASGLCICFWQGAVRINKDLWRLAVSMPATSSKILFSHLRAKKKKKKVSLKSFRDQGSEQKPVWIWQCGKVIGEGAEISSSAILSLYSLFTLLPAGTPLFISYLEPKILCYSERKFPKELRRLLEMMNPCKKIPLFTWLCTKHHLFSPNRFFF